MSTTLDVDQWLAKRLRAEREQREWSLADVAERSGVSKAMISKIERAEVSATASLLVRLAAAFDLTLADLLIQSDGPGSRLSRASSQPQWVDPETGYQRAQVLSSAGIPLEIAQIELPAGCRVSFPASSYHFGQQAVWLQKGRLSLTEGGDTHALAAGDCLAFGPPSEVTFANETDKPCRYVVVIARQKTA